MRLNKLGWPLLVLALMGTVALLGFGIEWPWSVVERHYIEPVSSRPYRVYTRSDHDPTQPASVLFALHAYASTPDVLLRGYPLRDLAVRARGMVLVVPEGSRDTLGQLHWNASAACCGVGTSRVDDLAYLRQVLTDLKRRLAVDATRVFAFGVSNGGFMAHRWASDPAASLRAIASVSGAGLAADELPKEGLVPLSVLQVHGDEDDIVLYAGGRMRGAEYPSARATVSLYLRAAGIARAPQVSATRTWPFGTIRREEWRQGDTRVALWTVQGGGHQLRAAQLSVGSILDFLEPRPRR